MMSAYTRAVSGTRLTREGTREVKTALAWLLYRYRVLITQIWYWFTYWEEFDDRQITEKQINAWYKWTTTQFDMAVFLSVCIISSLNTKHNTDDVFLHMQEIKCVYKYTETYISLCKSFLIMWPYDNWKKNPVYGIWWPQFINTFIHHQKNWEKVLQYCKC